MDEVVEHLRRVVLMHDGAGLSDGQLLSYFLEHRDEAAVAALVRRHAPMVWGVCRRVLGNHHDAEDAFQATFLVLVRKAASIAPREKVGNWLYGVAHQTALKARAAAIRRRAREKQVTDMFQAEATRPEPGADLRAVLDQELSRLPEKYRAPLVLCELESRTRKEAAGMLGLAEGTVASRLARARDLLARRLRRHVPAVSAGSVGTVLAAETAEASVPAEVMSSTIKAASLVAAGRAVAGVAPAAVAHLTEGVLKTMLLGKLRMVMAGLLLLGAAGLGGGLWHQATAHPARDSDRADEALATAGAKRDRLTLQGRWAVHEVRTDLKPGTLNVRKVWNIERDTLTWWGIPTPVLFRYSLDESRTPGHIDLTVMRSAGKDALPLGTTYKGIYALEGGRLRIAFTADGEERPGRIDEPVAGGVIVVLKRLPVEEKKVDANPPRNDAAKPEKAAAAPVAVSPFRVTVELAKTSGVRVNAPFTIRVAVVNTSRTPQSFRAMNGSWDQHWKCSNDRVRTHGPLAVFRNFVEEVKLQPGQVYEKTLTARIDPGPPLKEVKFKMGFTPYDSKQTYWSEEVTFAIEGD